jgi:hypothetical protein
MPQGSNGPLGGQLIFVWLAIGVVLALFAGVGAGVLAWLGGDKIPVAILKGSGAFAGTLTLVILIIGLLSS